MALALALRVSAHARVRGYSNYDGDTFRATFRIANIDTPELKGKCAHEIELAERAKLFTPAVPCTGRCGYHADGRGQVRTGAGDGAQGRRGLGCRAYSGRARTGMAGQARELV